MNNWRTPPDLHDGEAWPASELELLRLHRTPKHKTLKVFGRDGEATHRYTLRQAIEEGFILKEEAELWRGKVQVFRSLYGFLSQVVPYQDSDLERLLHLSASSLGQAARNRRGQLGGALRQVVSRWMGTEAYRRVRRVSEAGDTEAQPPSRSHLQLVEAARTEELAPQTARPRGFTVVEGRPEERYVTCVPLVPLAVAAGAFGGPQNVEAEDGWQWVELTTKRRVTRGMFVARVTGRSMEPIIPDGAYALFRAPVAGTRQGKTVLVELQDGIDAETGNRYTVKRYESEKGGSVDSWRHTKITLKPANPEFEPIVLADVEEDAVRVVAEFVEVIEM